MIWGGDSNVSIVVEVAFDNPPLTATASCTWVDITTHVRDVRTNRGRSTELSTYSPGTCTLTLDNRARLFDPSNTAGTYYGKLLPSKRVRVTMGVGATTEKIFAGYVTGWPIEYPGMVDAVVNVECVDATRLLEQAELGPTAYAVEVVADAPDAYWTLNEVTADLQSPAEAGDVDMVTAVATSTTATLPVGHGSDRLTTTFIASPPLTAAPLSAPPRTVEAWVTNWASSHGAAYCALHAWYGPDDYLTVTIGPDINIYYSNTADNRYVFNSVTYRMPVGPVHVAATVTTTTVTLYVDGSSVWSTAVGVGTLGSTFGVSGAYISSVTTPEPADRAFSNFAIYSTAVSAARITDHYVAGATGYGPPFGDRAAARIDRVLDTIGWPAADRDLSTGVTVLGPWLPSSGSALDPMREIESVEQGLFFIAADGDITFRDRDWQMANSRAATARTVFDDDGGAGDVVYQEPLTIDGNTINFIRNDVTVSHSSGSVRVKDATSVAAYGPQSESVSATLMATPAGWLARQLAAFRLRARKDPAIRVPRLSIPARFNVAVTGPELLVLDLGDRVTVNRRPTGGTGIITAQCVVQGISHTITEDEWTVGLYLAPTPKSYTEGPYLTMGDATYGRIGAAAGNLVPY